MKKEDEDNNLSNSVLVARGRPYVTKNNEIVLKMLEIWRV